MSKISLTGNANGSGTFTIASPNSNSDRILNLPDSAGTLATAESTLTQFNASGSAPVYACRAWVNFNGIGTVAIRASGNVSSITDNGTGNYTVNFATAMPDSNYAVATALGRGGLGALSVQADGTYNGTTSGVPLLATNAANSAIDPPFCGVAIFR